MASSVDFQTAAYRAQALPGIPVVHGSAKKYDVDTTAIKILVPTWTPKNAPASDKQRPALMKIDASAPVYIAFEDDGDAVAPTTGAEGSAAAPINVAMAVNQMRHFYLVAEAAGTVTISFYWA